MGFNELIAPLGLIFLGIMLKISHDEGWKAYKRYWLYLIIVGLLLLAYKIYKH
jgi:hypothetical protein